VLNPLSREIDQQQQELSKLNRIIESINQKDRR
jgi:hypothetical protein